MPALPLENIDERVLKLIDELDVARSAYDAAIDGGNKGAANKHLNRIREVAAMIDTLKYGAGGEPDLCARRSTKA